MRPSMIAATIAGSLASGCWSAEPPRPQTPHPDPVRAVREPYPRHSEWRGRYRCSQGLTEMTLVLDAEADGVVKAVFAFGPSADAPAVQPGSYRMIGRIRPGPQRTFVIALEPLEWIDAPDGYVMTPLTAKSSRRWTRLVGRIDHPACGELDVRRSD